MSSTSSEWQNLAKNKASEILKEVKDSLQFNIPIPIKDIIDSYLVDVCIRSVTDFDFPEGVSAFSQKDMNLGWLIIVNGKECIERQRFSAAHELGHIVLFPNSPSKVFCSQDNKNWDEKVCDSFAGDILMPEEMIHDIYQTNPSPLLEDIAKKFKVSRQVAEIQLKRLGLPFKRLVESF